MLSSSSSRVHGSSHFLEGLVYWGYQVEVKIINMSIYVAQTRQDAQVLVDNMSLMDLPVVGVLFDAWTSICPFRQALTHILI
jgi:hypothetical protein